MVDALGVTLEFVRKDESTDPYGFSFRSQKYLVRTGVGAYDTCRLAWQEGLLSDLSSVQGASPDPAAVERLGRVLREFLEDTDWARHERAIETASQDGRRVDLTIRSAAAELYALPWELLQTARMGRRLGELPGVVVHYEWPDTTTTRASEGAAPRVLVAWSDAAGRVPYDAHIDAIAEVCAAQGVPFDRDADVLPRVSTRALAAELAARPATVLHVLCHGQERDGTVGLGWSGADPDEPLAFVSPDHLQRLLAPHAPLLRTVVLCACRAGDPGALESEVGSLAQRLHRAGVATVVATRFLLGVDASVDLSRALHDRLARGESVADGVLAARAALTHAAGLDWAALQLHARGDAVDTRPLAAPEPETVDLPAEPVGPPSAGPSKGMLIGGAVGLALLVAAGLGLRGGDPSPGAETLAATPAPTPADPIVAAHEAAGLKGTSAEGTGLWKVAAHMASPTVQPGEVLSLTLESDHNGFVWVFGPLDDGSVGLYWPNPADQKAELHRVIADQVRRVPGDGVTGGFAAGSSGSEFLLAIVTSANDRGGAFDRAMELRPDLSFAEDGRGTPIGAGNWGPSQLTYRIE